MTRRAAIFTSEFPPYPGGIATYTFEIANAAKSVGLEPIVFAPVTPPSEQVNTTFEVRYTTPNYYRHHHALRSFFDATKILNKEPFDYVVAANLNFVIPISLVRSPAKKLAIVHGTDARSRLIGYINSFTPFRPYKAFDWIVANSEFTKTQLLRSNSMVSHDHVLVAPLGVSDYWRAPVRSEEVNKLTERFNIPSDRLIVLSVGRIERRKGLLQAVLAISRLPKEFRNQLTYLIAGREVDPSYAKDLAVAIHNSDADIRTIGVVTQDELRALYHRADILAHTATSDGVAVEGFGLVMLEAAACGLPSLATRVDAIPEVVNDGTTGVLVEDGNAEEISARIVAILQGTLPVKGMAIDCKEHAAAFTWENCARRTFRFE